MNKKVNSNEKILEVVSDFESYLEACEMTHQESIACSSMLFVRVYELICRRRAEVGEDAIKFDRRGGDGE